MTSVTVGWHAILWCEIMDGVVMCVESGLNKSLSYSCLHSCGELVLPAIPSGATSRTWRRTPNSGKCASFMLSSTCSFYLLSALFFCRPHKPDYAFLSLYSFFNFVSAGRRDSQVRTWGGSQTLTNAPLAQHTISPPFLWFSLLPPPDLTHLTAQPNLREMSL